MIVYIYNIGVDLYNGFNGLRHRINWTYFTVLDGLAHPLYSVKIHMENKIMNYQAIITDIKDIISSDQKIAYNATNKAMIHTY